MPAEGTHLNETSYVDMMPILKKHGFSKFKILLPVPKLKKLFPKLRLSPSILIFIEKHNFILNCLYKLKYKGIPILRFETILICSKK